MSTNENAVQDALMHLLEVKFNLFMADAELSCESPEETTMVRAAYFTGINAGILISRTIRGEEES